MKEIRCIILIWSLAALVTGRASSGDHASRLAQVVSVRYYDRSEPSRLVISVDGDFSYMMRKEGSTIRVLFSGATVSRFYEGARLRFWTGNVSGASVDRSPDSGAVVTVSCLPHTLSRVRRADKMNGLCLDVFRDSSAAIRQDTLLADTTSVGVHAQVVLPIKVISVSGLVSAAKSDSGQENRAGAPSGDQVSPRAGSVLDGFRLVRIDFLPTALVFASSALSTVLLLMVIRRSYRRKPVLLAVEAVRGFPEILLSQAVSANHDSAAQKDSPRPDPVLSTSRPDDSVVGLAKTYGRGRGEISLSFALKARQGEKKWIRTVEELAEAGETDENKVRVARELGVGKGEVDLAMKFRRAQSSEILKKEMV